MTLIGVAFTLLAIYLAVQSTWVLAAEYRPRHSFAGIAWTAMTAAVMYALAAGKAHGAALDNPVLRTEGRVTLVDAILATAVVTRPVLNAAAGGGGPIPPPVTSLSSTQPEKSAASCVTIRPVSSRTSLRHSLTREHDPEYARNDLSDAASRAYICPG